MVVSRVRVLEIAAEGAGFELDADIGTDARPVAFYAHTGGATDWDELYGDAPEAPRLDGPLTWAVVLERYLRPHGWLDHHPRLVHLAITDLVRDELVTASSEVRARWAPALRSTNDED